MVRNVILLGFINELALRKYTEIHFYWSLFEGMEEY